MNVSWTTSGRAVARRLRQLGVRHIFSLPGSQVLPIWDGLYRGDVVQIIVPRSERAAAFMAEGYGLAGGRPAVLMSTLGPGVANEIVGVRSALMSRAPVLCVSPYQPAAKYPRFGEIFQGLEHPRFFDGSCKHTSVVESEDASTLAEILDRAWRETLSDPPGPVRVDISFPLLFRRRLRRAGPPPTVGLVQNGSPTLLLVSEGSDGLPQAAQEIASRPAAKRLSPGLETAGSGLPFALGARFACPDVPVVLFTQLRLLKANPDTLAVARSYGVPVRLAGGEVNAGRLEELSRAFDLDFRGRIPPPEALPDWILAEKTSLTIVAD